MREKLDKYFNTGNGIFIIGALWLLFWLGPALFLFEEDPRWGHNFAIPILFIIVGLAYNMNKNSCFLIAMIASYITIPSFIGYWAWDIATLVASIFLGILLIVYAIDRTREQELLHLKQRSDFWLKTHGMTISYLGLVHMSLIFFFVRWNSPEPYLEVLPIEHHASTSVFNAMLIVLAAVGFMDRTKIKLGRFTMQRVGFAWSILMIIIPLIVIGIVGD